MIETYVNTFINNLPDKTKTKQKLDLVLGGGAFNGSYLIGSLYFLKEMEKQQYIVIERISGCSVGAIIAFMYYIDSLDLIPNLYESLKRDFKRNKSITIIKNMKTILSHRIPDNICDKINNKLYICYNNVKTKKKIVKHTYIDIDDVIDTIIKSSYVPFIIDHCLVYNKKYIDGFNPHIFKKVEGKKILYIDLLNYDKIMCSINVKNEKTNIHRILHGLLDIHNFYIKQTNTSMCSYVDEWSFIHKINHYLKWLFEKIIIYMVHLIIYFKKILLKDVDDNNVILKIISTISFDIFDIIFDKYLL